MNQTLHITNGDSSADAMREAGILGDILPWRDVLHIGPVQNHDTWELFDRARIEFLISVNLANEAFIKQTFEERRAVMSQLDLYEKIYLWFEHDLYDQLQLLQIIKYLTPQLRLYDRINLIVTDMYLGQAKPSDFHDLFRFSEPLSVNHIAAVEPYWLALTHHTPVLLNELNESEALPFMHIAFKRLCEEYPSTLNGLNRVQSTIVELLRNECKGSELFSRYQATEESRFMGDSVFALILNHLVNCKHPLLAFKDKRQDLNVLNNELIVTDMGYAVQKAQKNHIFINGIDTWIGGVHLNSNNLWCYNTKSNHFISQGLN